MAIKKYYDSDCNLGVLDGMLERKRQGRDRLSTPCRNRQAFQSTLPFARL